MTHQERAREMATEILSRISMEELDTFILQNLIEASNDELERRRAVDWTEMVGHFHRLMGVPILDRPGFPSPERTELRKRLISEEHDELFEALYTGDLVKVADGIADLIYVLIGTALEFGIPIRGVFSEVQRSNISKVGPDGKPIVREDGKVLKPEGWRPPDIKRILLRHGARL